jgi:hypothetical protein
VRKLLVATALGLAFTATAAGSASAPPAALTAYGRITAASYNVRNARPARGGGSRFEFARYLAVRIPVTVKVPWLPVVNEQVTSVRLFASRPVSALVNNSCPSCKIL